MNQVIDLCIALKELGFWRGVKLGVEAYWDGDGTTWEESTKNSWMPTIAELDEGIVEAAKKIMDICEYELSYDWTHGYWEAQLWKIPNEMDEKEAGADRISTPYCNSVNENVPNAAWRVRAELLLQILKANKEAGR